MSIIEKNLDELFSHYLPEAHLKASSKNSSSETTAPLEIREEQIALAKNIERTFSEGGIYIAEAGTGIGKSFAYLIPGIRKALQKKPVVIVTRNHYATTSIGR